MYTKCIPHFDKLLCTFCLQNLAAIVVLVLYTKCIQIFVKMWDTFCIHLVYILYTSCKNFVYKMYTQFLCRRSLQGIKKRQKFYVRYN